MPDSDANVILQGGLKWWIHCEEIQLPRLNLVKIFFKTWIIRRL